MQSRIRLASIFFLFYLLASQVKAKFSSILNLWVKSSEQTYDESNGIIICDWCCDFHYKCLKPPSLYIPSVEEIKSSPFIYGCFSFHLGNVQSHCKQSNHFHQKAKDAFNNIRKEKTGSESEADRAKKLLSTSKRKH